MTDMKEAFEKVGLPTASVAFAAACYDLARLALNREAEPRRAVHVFLGLASGMGFRGLLEEYLAEIAKERIGEKSSAEARDHLGGGDFVDRLLSDREVEPLVGRARSSLQKDRVTGTGIPFVRVGRLVRYRHSDVIAYIASLPSLRSTEAS